MKEILQEMKKKEDWKEFLQKQQFLVYCSMLTKQEEVYNVLKEQIDSFNLHQTWLNEEWCNQFNILYKEEYEVCALDIAEAANSERGAKMLRTCKILQEVVGQRELKQFVLHELLEKPKFMNYVLTGPPGIGKTEFAGKFSRVFGAEGMGYFDKGSLKEVNKGSIIGVNAGTETELIPKIIQEAQKEGCDAPVLFIDEAYHLSEQDKERDPHAFAARQAIFNALNTEKGKIVFVFAGYADKMAEFMKTNPGNARRMTYRELKPYTAVELTVLFFEIAEKEELKMDKEEVTIPLVLPVMKKLSKSDHWNEHFNVGGIVKLVENAKRRGVFRPVDRERFLEAVEETTQWVDTHGNIMGDGNKSSSSSNNNNNIHNSNN